MVNCLALLLLLLLNAQTNPASVHHSRYLPKHRLSRSTAAAAADCDDGDVDDGSRLVVMTFAVESFTLNIVTASVIT